MELSLAAGLAFEASAIQYNMLQSIMTEREIKSLILISIFGRTDFLHLTWPLLAVREVGRVNLLLCQIL